MLSLLDVRMPGMSGLEMVTGVNEEETGRQALEMGAFDYIVKPLTLAYLEHSLWDKITTMLL
jgi:YesN/AraC family two-component response regulator